MMKDLLRNGVVNGELQVPQAFSLYKSGVLSSQNMDQNNSGEITDKDQDDYGIAWQKLNHSITIIGWGVEEGTGTKYWILNNSYGPKWGNNGRFWVKRGVNEFGIESESTGYDVRLCDQTKSSDKCEILEPMFK